MTPIGDKVSVEAKLVGIKYSKEYVRTIYIEMCWNNQ